MCDTSCVSIRLAVAVGCWIAVAVGCRRLKYIPQVWFLSCESIRYVPCGIGFAIPAVSVSNRFVSILSRLARFLRYIFPMLPSDQPQRWFPKARGWETDRHRERRRETDRQTDTFLFGASVACCCRAFAFEILISFLRVSAVGLLLRSHLRCSR